MSKVALDAALDAQVLGRWPLRTDASDASGRGMHGQALGISFGSGAAEFDGLRSRIIIPAAQTSGEEWTLAAWVEAGAGGGAVGDVASQFDARTRCGFTLSINSNTGGPHNQPNRRQVHLGWDDGSTPSWQEHGRPGRARSVTAFLVHGGALYAATHEADGPGGLYRYQGKQAWELCAVSPDQSNFLAGLTSFENKIFFTTACYDGSGSMMPKATNLALGGRVFAYEPSSGAVTSAGVPPQFFGGLINNLGVFRDRLYAISGYHPGLARYEGEERWSVLPTPEFGWTTLCPFGDELFASAKRLRAEHHPGAVTPTEYPSAFRFDGRRWESCGFLPQHNEQIYAFAAYRGELYAGTWDQGRIFRWQAEVGAWADCGGCGLGPLGPGKPPVGEIMGMAVYNGALYVGTLPHGEVYRYDGAQQWTMVGCIDPTPGVPMRRAWSMAVFDGRLWSGTLPAGKVWAMSAGAAATWDHELPAGWSHLAAVKRRQQLNLFINGRLAASAPLVASAARHLQTQAPFLLGEGAHNRLRGRMRDARLYGTALDETRIAALAAAEPTP